MINPLYFSCESIQADGTVAMNLLAVPPSKFIIAGWTGRDTAAIEHHIQELEALGVPRPSAVPLYYHAGQGLLNQDSLVEVVGADSSGEAEPVLFFADGEWWLTVGSDHTDRTVESYSVAVSKQMCPKPLATAAWRWSDVSGRQDGIQLASRIFEDGQWVDYQQGTLASIRPLESLRDGCFDKSAVAGSFMFCGTLGAIPNAAGKAIRPASAMEISLRDPVRNRAIVHRYTVKAWPVIA